MGSELPNLKPYYEYWDAFVSHWFRCGGSCCRYLPEPWWGWHPNSGKPLHSVVINLNPDEGGPKQTRESLNPILAQHTYSEAIKKEGGLTEHLSETHNWHSNNRAKPILSILPDYDKSDIDYIDHHLSIELLPLHSATSVAVESYVNGHYKDVLDYVLRFAADASIYIIGSLNSVVIVRCSANRFTKMFAESHIKPLDGNKVDKSPFWCRIDLPGFEGVKFVCVWSWRNNISRIEISKIINTINISE